ncbi:MAG: inverse autotransporter beta domain-containing protein [Deferribacteraceae bacterium]|nr:inverse autotransporter beta domain-containing protein [Deferribacteraceae bacterium]
MIKLHEPNKAPITAGAQEDDTLQDSVQREDTSRDKPISTATDAVAIEPPLPPVQIAYTPTIKANNPIYPTYGIGNQAVILVGTSSLNVRSGPSVSSSKMALMDDEGQVFVVIDETADWVKIDDKDGWVNKAYMKPVATPILEPELPAATAIDAELATETIAEEAAALPPIEEPMPAIAEEPSEPDPAPAQPLFTGNADEAADYIMQWGLDYGSDQLNRFGEAAFSEFTGSGRARLDFHMDIDTQITGEGELLLPLHDGQYATVFTQVGMQSTEGMNDSNRWIGNLGLGQRWYPSATIGADGAIDSGEFMFGYNIFYDYDFTRSHQRGGVGLEAKYAWLDFAVNYYFPLSGWQESPDFAGGIVEERAAQGWDLRLRGTLPFYHNIALEGAYSKWRGTVSAFGSSDIEINPAVWSYGIEYMPVPLLSTYLRQGSTGEHTQTELGLRLTYRMGVALNEQVSSSRVAALHTINDSRHDFVDRETSIVLEYRAQNSYNIFYVGTVGVNAFKFRITDGFGRAVANKQATVSVGNGVTLAAAEPQPIGLFAALKSFFSGVAYAADRNYRSDAAGEFIVTLDSVSTTSVELSIEVENTKQSFVLDTQLTTLTYALEASTDNMAQYAATGVTFTFKRNGVAVPNNTVVSFTTNANFANLPTTALTDALGQVTVLNLTATTAGTHTIEATIDGETLSITVTVSISPYTMEASVSDLTQGVGTSVTFTFKQNGTAVSGGSVIFTSYTNFSGLSNGSSNAAGQLTVSNLTATAIGGQSIEATIDGNLVMITLPVYSYSMEASPTSLALNTASAMTFTFKRNGEAVPAGLAVSFSGANFSGLPTGSTNAAGQMASSVTATAQGSQTIQATIRGQTLSTAITVNNYSMEISPTELARDVATSVTFTFKLNGVALAGTAVSFMPNADFTNLPTSGTTNALGQITVPNLIGTTEGNKTIAATIGGQSVSAAMVVNFYTVDISASTLRHNAATTMTFTFKRNGVAVPAGVAVSFTGANFTGLPTGNTNAAGQMASSITASTAGSQIIQAVIDGQTINIPMNIVEYSLVIGTVIGGGDFTSSHTTATIPVTLMLGGVAASGLAETITWSVVSADNSANLAVETPERYLTVGLQWGNTAKSTGITNSTVYGTNTAITNLSGLASIMLSDIIGERTVIVRASVVLDGMTKTAEKTITFGRGPLSRVRIPNGDATYLAPLLEGWAACNNGIHYSGDYTLWVSGQDIGSKLPTVADLQALYDDTNASNSMRAAGWTITNQRYITRITYGTGSLSVVDMSTRTVYGNGVSSFDRRFVCLR